MSDARPPTQVSLEPARFTVTPALLGQFRILFGDAGAASGLADGVPFAAGVLPLFFFTVLKWRKVLPRRMAFEKLSATVAGPFAEGDALELSALVYPSLGGPGRMEVEFDVCVRATRAPVCSGSGVLGPTPPGLDGGELAFDDDAPVPEVRMPAKPLAANAWRFDQIEKGQTAAFDFGFTRDALRALHALVLSGAPAHAPGWHEWIETIDPRPLLLAPVSTTAAALLAPARGTACASVEMEFNQPPAIGDPCRIKGAVTAKSESPRSLLGHLTISDLDLKAVFATAKVLALVH